MPESLYGSCHSLSGGRGQAWFFCKCSFAYGTLLECDPQARPQGSHSLLGAASSWILFACPLFPLFSKTNCDKSL